MTSRTGAKGFDNDHLCQKTTTFPFGLVPKKRLAYSCTKFNEECMAEDSFGRAASFIIHLNFVA